MRFGVDEAGKGPVLGSMFAAAVACEPAALPEGVGDSKDRSPARRETLTADIRKVARVGIAEIPVARIDDPATDMNGLTVAGQAEALTQVATDGLAGTVDAGDVDADRFGRRVSGAVDANVTVDARHGADATDPLVGAASIVAKVERDAHVQGLAERYAEHFGERLPDPGSGYPSDPNTRDFLAAYVEHEGELPACARSSWATCDDVLAAREQSALGEF